MTYFRTIGLSAFGFAVGVLSGVSFLRTVWSTFQIDFFFWWSIVSTILGLVFIGTSIWQHWVSRSQIEKNNAQVKVWMQDADGIRQALKRIIGDNLNGRYSSTNDMANAIWSVEANASALYLSLYEERCVTEDQYIARQKKLAELLNRKQFADLERDAVQAENSVNPTPTLPELEERPG